ncbi:hypothetical protein [Phytobacter diazotrophicus]|uniref:hypothetical protein n=1 Tax=Phytobacter diazotrophicus TaxID=395631 RepID=UPI0030765D76
MNTFHEINLMTSRGDIHGAFSLIRDRSESVARKIMKRAGYSVPVHTGRAFWMWVQETLLRASREQKNGYKARAERKHPVRGYRQQMQEDYEAWVQMMSHPEHEEYTSTPAESENKATIASARISSTEPKVNNNMTAMRNMKINFHRALLRSIKYGNQCRQEMNYSCQNVLINTFSFVMLRTTAFSLLMFLCLLIKMSGKIAQIATNTGHLLLYEILSHARLT